MNILVIIFKKLLFNSCSYVTAKRARRIALIRKDKKNVVGTSEVIAKVATTKHALVNN